MDFASVIGFLACISIVIYGIVTGNQGVAALFNFIDMSSVCITFGGSFSCVLASYNSRDFINGLKSFGQVLKNPTINDEEIIGEVIELSTVARKEGLLALEEAANEIEDPFLKKGIILVVDGTEATFIRDIMETEISCAVSRHQKCISFWDSLAAMGPAWGMIGTLIGLINMLKQLDDVSSIGPNMAVALVTTFYGSMLANWIAIPISTKLKNNNDLEVQTMMLMLEGILSIQAGENPRIIEEKLKSFLSPADRYNFLAAYGGNMNE